MRGVRLGLVVVQVSARVADTATRCYLVTLVEERFPCRYPTCRIKLSSKEYRIKHEKTLHGVKFE